MSKSYYKCIKCIIYVLLIFCLLFMIFGDLTFRYDEGFTMALIHHNFVNLIKLDSFDVHPPLYYISLKIFIYITTFWSKSIFIKIIFARIFSLISFLIGIIFLRKMVINMGINKSFLFQISLLLLFLSISFFCTQIRMYAFAGMLFSLQFYTLSEYDELNNNKYLMYSLFWAILTSYTNYFAALSAGLLLLVSAFVDLSYSYMKNCKKKILASILLLLVYIPWLIYSSQTLLNVTKSKRVIRLKSSDILNFIKNPIVDISGISDSSIDSMNVIMKLFIILLIICVIIYLYSWSNSHLKYIFNLKFHESLFVFILTSIVGTIIQIFGLEFSPRFVYPSFIIVIFFVTNILLRYVEINMNKNYLKLIIVIPIIFIFGMNITFSYYYNYINFKSSVKLVNSVDKIKSSNLNDVYIRNINNNNNNIVNSREPLLENRHSIFYISDCATYLLYYNKKIVIKDLRNKDFPINYPKIGHRIWPNLINKENYKYNKIKL